MDYFSYLCLVGSVSHTVHSFSVFSFLYLHLFPAVLLMDCPVLLGPTVLTLIMMLGPLSNCPAEFMRMLPAFTHITKPVCVIYI